MVKYHDFSVIILKVAQPESEIWSFDSSSNAFIVPHSCYEDSPLSRVEIKVIFIFFSFGRVCARNLRPRKSLLL